MKLNLKSYLLGCLSSLLLLILGIVIVVALIVFGFNSAFGKDEFAHIQDNTFLIFEVPNEISDYDFVDFDIFSRVKSASLHSIRQKIKDASEDDRIGGIVLKFSTPSSIPLSKVSELGSILQQFKESGKKVYAHIDYAFDKSYLLATFAQKIALNPSASSGIALMGLSAQNLYYKKLLDKIGVDVMVVSAGKAKSFGEPFIQDFMSRAAKENLNTFLLDIYENLKNEISSNRNIKNIDFIYQNRESLFVNQSEAVELNLVDELASFGDFLEKLGITHKVLLQDYYFEKESNSKQQKVAVVYLSGVITPDETNEFGTQSLISAENVDEQISEIEKQEDIKAIVLRINSPGGSSLESEIILNHILQKTSLPVISSFDAVAASGGYYIAAKSDYIFADKYSLTGSIGVFAIVPFAKDLTDKIGISVDGVSLGRYAEIFNTLKKPSKTLEKQLKIQVEDVYQEFVENVAQGRNLTTSEVEQLAEGLIYTGKQAKEQGLVDEIGNLEDAIQKAADIADLDDFLVVYYPERVSILTKLFEGDFSILYNLVQNREFLKFKLLFDNFLDQPIQSFRNFYVE